MPPSVNAPLGKPASKKQTLESVWYPRDGGGSRDARDVPQRSRRSKASGTAEREKTDARSAPASKKQTLESVWYRSTTPWRKTRPSRLKEADARKRLVQPANIAH